MSPREHNSKNQRTTTRSMEKNKKQQMITYGNGKEKGFTVEIHIGSKSEKNPLMKKKEKKSEERAREDT
jgi:hypothetical protein